MTTQYPPLTWDTAMTYCDEAFRRMNRANVAFHANTGMLWDNLNMPRQALSCAFDIVAWEALDNV